MVYMKMRGMAAAENYLLMCHVLESSGDVDSGDDGIMAPLSALKTNGFWHQPHAGTRHQSSSSAGVSMRLYIIYKSGLLAL